MLLWAVIAVCFATCVACWHLWKGITTGEAVMLVVACGISFFLGMRYIYDKATTDYALISGYSTSLLHWPSYTYGCGKNDQDTCHQPETWQILQTTHKPRSVERNKLVGGASSPVRSVGRSILDGGSNYHSGGSILVDCIGECTTVSATGNNESRPFADRIYAIGINSKKFWRTQPGDPSTVLQKYYNPVQASDDVVYSDEKAKKIPYFRIFDYNTALRSTDSNEATRKELEEINAEFAGKGISLGLIITKDELYFEKLKRAWHLGKYNDFVIVAATDEDGKTLKNVNILAWDNYGLREEVATAVMGVGAPNPAKILDAVRDTLRRDSDFSCSDFRRYGFLEIKIPPADWVFLMSFQALFLAYMLWLMDKNPTGKDRKPTAAEIMETWDKHGHAPLAMQMHPLSPGGVFFFYTSAPFILFQLWKFIFQAFGY